MNLSSFVSSFDFYHRVNLSPFAVYTQFECDCSIVRSNFVQYLVLLSPFVLSHHRSLSLSCVRSDANGSREASPVCNASDRRVLLFADSTTDSVLYTSSILDDFAHAEQTKQNGSIDQLIAILAIKGFTVVPPLNRRVNQAELTEPTARSVPHSVSGALDRARSVRIQLSTYAVANASAVSLLSAPGQRQSPSAPVVFQQHAQPSLAHAATTDWDASDRETFFEICVSSAIHRVYRYENSIIPERLRTIPAAKWSRLFALEPVRSFLARRRGARESSSESSRRRTQ